MHADPFRSRIPLVRTPPGLREAETASVLLRPWYPRLPVVSSDTVIGRVAWGPGDPVHVRSGAHRPDAFPVVLGMGAAEAAYAPPARPRPGACVRQTGPATEGRAGGLPIRFSRAGFRLDPVAPLRPRAGLAEPCRRARVHSCWPFQPKAGKHPDRAASSDMVAAAPAGAGKMATPPRYPVNIRLSSRSGTNVRPEEVVCGQTGPRPSPQGCAGTLARGGPAAGASGAGHKPPVRVRSDCDRCSR